MRLFRKTALALSLAAPANAEDLAGDLAAIAADRPGFALGVGVATSGSAPQVHAFGPIHIGSGTNVALGSRWHIGSISKSFTATLVMQQVDKGALSLDAPIATYLPEVASNMDPSWQALTLRQLLSHTAGLPANPGITAMRKRGSDDLHSLREEVLAGLWNKPVTPGNFAYSNIGYVLAGYVLEVVTGQSWEDLIRRDIAIPLGLSSLGFGAPDGPHDPWGHRNWIIMKRPVDPKDKGSDNPPWLGPAGTLHMSLTDLTQWGQAHLEACRGERPAFLSQASCMEMQAARQDNYGLGWVIADGGRVWHNGSNTLWYAVLSVSHETDQVIAVTTNVLDTKTVDTLVQKLTQTQ